MKESAAAALSYVKTATESFDGDGDSTSGSARTTSTFTCPRARSPRTGPSAGITMATALASRITGRPVRADTAMTGEITLTGQVLPIGGLKEKALAAQRAEIKRLIIPRPNEPDIDDIPAHLRKRLKFILVDSVDEVLDAALEKRRAKRRAPRGDAAISG